MCQEFEAFLDGFVLFKMGRVALQRGVIRASFGRPVNFEQDANLKVFNIHLGDFALCRVVKTAAHRGDSVCVVEKPGFIGRNRSLRVQNNLPQAVDINVIGGVFLEQILFQQHAVFGIRLDAGSHLLEVGVLNYRVHCTCIVSRVGINVKWEYPTLSFQVTIVTHRVTSSSREVDLVVIWVGRYFFCGQL